MIKLPYILVVIGWISFIIIDYYAHNTVFMPFLSAVIISISVFSVIFIIRMLLKKDSLKRGLYKMSVVLFLVVLLFCYSPAKSIMEDADWLINYNSRMKVVEKIKTESYHPDAHLSKNASLEYEYDHRQLSFRFPILSPPHNEVIISRNTKQNTCSIYFYVYGSSCTEQTYFVYTNDKKAKTRIDELMMRDSKDNWKLRDHWYRIKVDEYF